MKKRVLMLINMLLIINIGVSFNLTLAYADTVGTIDFKYLEYDDCIEISAFIGNEKIVEIPQYIAGKKVTIIGKNSFSDNKEIENVIIPEGVTEIKENAFSQSSITNISLPSTLNKIGMGAFYGCTALESIIIPEGIEEIPPLCFGVNWSLKSITLPSSLKSIGKDAIYGMSQLDYIIIPDSVARIEASAFAFTDINGNKTIVFICSKDSYAAGFASENGITNANSIEELNKIKNEQQTEILTTKSEEKESESNNHGKNDNIDDKNNYSSDKKVIHKEKLSLKVKKKERKIKVFWNNIHAVGYELQYSIKKNFKNSIRKYTGKTSYTLYSLKKNNKYYLRVRAYEKSNSKKIFGKWSKVKCIKK